MTLHGDGVDAGIRAYAAGHLPQGLAYVQFLEVNDLGAHRFREIQAVRQTVNRDNPVRAERERALNCKQTHGAASPNRDNVARFDFTVICSHPSRRKNIGEKEHLLILDAIGDDERSHIRVRHPHIFRLTAGVATREMGVSEGAGHGVPVQALGHVGGFRRI